MSNKHYSLYIDSALELAETIVLKSALEADTINEWVILNNGVSSVDYSDKTTWKYYKNICGEYHTTDDLIYITSLDTIGTIAFTKANLAQHPVTKEAYRYNSRYYRELLLENPDREQLIFGVLHPAVMSEAISAKDGTILSFPKYLVEENEISFIYKLQGWIFNWLFRWYNIQFNNNHSHYYTATKGVLHLCIVGEILSLRLRACRTDEVHSFHVREYLTSHNGLDVYLDYMTRKQALFFYRNIAYIERNSGKQDTFKWLVEKVLSDRGIPLSQFSMRHDVSKLPTEYYPDIVFRKSAVNNVYSQQDMQETNYGLTTILEKEVPLAAYNRKYVDEYSQPIENLFIDSSSNVVQTKMLESSMLDYTDSTPYTLQDIGFNHWVYFSQAGLYTAYVRIPHPKTGTEVVITAKEAVIYYMYLYMKVVDFGYQDIPNFGAMRVVKHPYPTVTEMMTVVNTAQIPVSKAQEILDTLPSVGTMVSIAAFTNTMLSLYEAAQTQIVIVASEERHFLRGMTHNLTNSLYQDVILDFTGGASVNYNDWLDSKALPGAELTAAECYDLYKVVYESATGISLKSTAALAALQKAMIGIMTQLSSYSIQFLTQINSASVRPLNWAMIRPDNLVTITNAHHFVEDSDTTVIDVTSSEMNIVAVELDPIVVAQTVVTKSTDYQQIDIPVKVTINLNATRRFIELSMMNYSVDSPIFELPPGAGQLKYLPSYQNFYDLTEEQKQTIKSVHSYCFPDPVENTHVDIADVITRDTLDSFKYLSFTQPKLNSFVFVYLPSDVENGIKVTISADLDALQFSGGTLMGNGVAMIGFDHFIDAFTDIGNNVNVNGIFFKPEIMLIDTYELQDNFGLGISMPRIKFVTDTADFVMTSPVQYAQLNLSFIINEKQQSGLDVVTDKHSSGLDVITECSVNSVKFATDNKTLPLSSKPDFATLTNRFVIDVMQVNMQYSVNENMQSVVVYAGDRTDFAFGSYTKESSTIAFGINVKDTIGLDVTAFDTDNVDFGFDSYSSDTIHFDAIAYINDIYEGIGDGPFYGNPDAIGGPFYSLGSFVISGIDGKVIFNID